MSKLVIDLSAIVQNIKTYKKLLLKNQKFCAVVKADAYGFGSPKICKTINSFVDYFAVSSKEEFFEIKSLVTKPVLILDPIYENITKLAKNKCELCVSNMTQFNQILKEACYNKNVIYKIHLAVNTGMNRFGFSKLNEILSVFEVAQKTQNIAIVGVFSHFYAGNDKIASFKQIKKLQAIKERLNKYFDISKIIFHIAASNGMFFANQFDMVRCGYNLYTDDIFRTITLKSKIIEIQNIVEGDGVGYSHIFVAKQDMKIAIVAIGYADGIKRKIVSKGFVLINGEYCKILAVCMDSIIVDITGIDANILDDVILIGESKDKCIFICDFASWCDTIGYEIIVGFSKRIKREYVKGDLCKLSRESIEQEN